MRDGRPILRRTSALGWKARLSLLLGSVCLPALPAQAQTVWTGAVSTDWFTAGNWGAGVPAAGIPVIVNTANGLDPLVAGPVTGRAGRVVVGDNPGQSGALNVTGALTVDENTFFGSLLVGNQGTGTVTVSDGGRLVTGLTGIGNFGTGVGTVTVTGAGSTWTAGSIDIGSSGNGTLNVQGGGTVSGGSFINVGNDLGAVGAINVSGAGSVFSSGVFTNVGAAAGGSGTVTVSDGGQFNGGIFTIGSFGQGELTVQSGAAASGSTVTIGGNATGIATVTGVGSTLTSVASTVVGASATGTLTVSAGGVVNSARGRLGTTATGNGTATVTGAGSRWNVTNDFIVGEAGTGTLNVEAGGVVASNTVVIGSNAGAHGDVVVSGTGSQLNAATSLYVGLASNVFGTGTLSVLDGGSVTIGSGGLGDYLVANNSTAITVDGTGSQLTITQGNPGTPSFIRLGIRGVNSLDVTDGGSVSFDRADFNTAAGSSVAVAVDGIGTTWTSNGFELGGAGAASFTVSNGASVDTGAREVSINATAGGTAALAVSSGGSLTGTGVLWLRGGTLTVDSGGDVTVGQLNLGTSDGSNATATVTGTGSTLTTIGVLSVGNGSDGTLLVNDGASLVTANAGIATSTAGTGTVTLSGAGTTWTASNPAIAFVDIGANGSLTIEQAATMTVTGTVSSNTRVSGALVVRDAGSLLQSSLSVGVGGSNGAVQILNGGAVESQIGVVGVLSAGVVTVDGTNSRWTLIEDLDIGLQAAGTLNIQNNGRVSAGNDISIGCCSFGGDGTVNVTGSGALMEAGGTLRLGDSGNGTLNLTAGGDVTSAAALIGAGGSGVGAATISGAGSTWVNAGTLAVGGSGAGTLTIREGGTVSNASADIGALAGSTGTVTVDNGTWTNTGDLSVGFDGAGTLAIENGGAVGNAIGFIGRGAGSTGTVAVSGTGASWTNTSSLFVGTAGAGTLNIANGGAVSSTDGYIGNLAGATGTVTVAGAGASWTNSASLQVAGLGVGTLNVQNGGTVSNTFAIIGGVADSTGTVTVDNGTWTNTGSLTVADAGTGTLIVRNGGTVSSAAAILGANAGATGTAVVDGAGSSWTSWDEMRIGFIGAGTLDILNGGTVSNSNAFIGVVAGATGTVTVGDGTWTNTGSLTVADAGTGTLIVRDGGTASATGVVIAASAGSTGMLAIGAVAGAAAAAPGTLDAPTVQFGDGDGEIVFNHTDAAYAFTPTIAGSGAVLVENGTTILTATSTYTGGTTVNGGTLLVNGSIAGSAVTVNGGGTLGGTGTLGAVSVGDGGRLAPGNSIGTINVATLTLLPGSTYEVEINGGGNVAGVNNDLVVVAGAATVNAGAILHVTPENGTDDGTTYAANTTYTIIRASALTVDALPVITDDFAFLDFTASYDPALGEFYLTSSAAAASFCLPGASFNQCSTGEAVRALGPGNPVYDAVLGLNPGDARRAFTLASGEIHASGQHVTGQAFALFSRTLRQQAAAVSGTGSQTGAFAAALGGRGQVDGDGNAAKLDWWTAGVAGGYQIALGSGAAVAGIAVGYLRSGGRVDGRRSSLDADGFHAGVYGGWSDGSLSLAGSLAYAAHSLSTTRRIAVGGLRETARADYWSHSVGFSGQAAYGFNLGAGTTLAPLLTIDAGWSGHGGFRERGAGALNLRGKSEGWARFDTGIGLALSHAVATGSGKLALDGRVLWEHAFADVVPDQDMAFAGGGNRFEVRGPDAGRDRLRLGLGLSFAASDALTIRASYDGMLARRQQGHGGSIGISFRF